MRKADIKADGTIYAVATASEGRELGAEWGITFAKVIAFDQRREYYPAGSWRSKVANDGVLVENVLGKQFIVRTAAIKGTKEEHEEILRIRKESEAKHNRALADMATRAKNVMAELRDRGLDVPDYRYSTKTLRIELTVAQLEELLAGE